MALSMAGGMIRFLPRVLIRNNLSSRFCCILTQQLCLKDQHNSRVSPFKQRKITANYSYHSRRTFLKRYLMDIEKNFSRDKMDKKEFEMVYQCGSPLYIFGAVCVSQITAIPAAIQTYLYFFKPSLFDWNNVAPNLLVQTGTDLVIFTGVYWLITVAMYFFTRLYPLRIYHDPKTKKFVFVFYKFVLLRRTKVECLEGEVKPWLPDINMYKTKQRVVYLDYNAFRIPQYYNLLLGYTKRK